LDCGAVKVGELRKIPKGEEFKCTENQERKKQTKEKRRENNRIRKQWKVNNNERADEPAPLMETLSTLPARPLSIPISRLAAIS
jgi:hypothetical protein